MKGESTPPSSVFLEHLPPTARERMATLDDLDERLDRILSEMRETWPEFTVDSLEFMSYLAGHVPDHGDPVESLANMRTGDLYLAAACLNGDEGAVRVFVDRYYAVMERALSGLRQDPGWVDDIKQVVYQKLFVAGPDSQGTIGQYDGRGDLKSWVKVVAVRTALNAMRRKKKERPLSPEILSEAAGKELSPETGYLKRVYTERLKEAFQQALGAITHKQRNLLRYHYLEGLTVDEIAGLYRVHKATVSRWLADTRDRLLTGTRTVLARRLKVDGAEIDSIMRLVQSRLELSIRRFL